MSFIALIQIVASIITCFSQLTWNISDPLPTGYASLATGYDANTGSLWIIGGMRYTGSTQWSHKVIQYNISNSTFTYHTDFVANNGNYGARFIGQIYTQINNSIWFIIAQSFGVFFMDNQTVIYPYSYNVSSVTIPLWTYDRNGIWPDQPCLTSYQSRYLIIIGGDSDTDMNVGKQFQIYDIATNSWLYSNYSLPPLSISRGYFACQTVNDYLYAIGGMAGGYSSGVTNTIEKIYLKNMANLQNEEWYTLTDTLTERKYRIRCCVIGNDIYVIGGEDYQLNRVSTVDKINTINDRVVKETDISVPRFDVGLTAVDRYLYVIGGMDMIPGDYVSDVVEYSFKELTPPPTAIPSESPTNPTLNPTQIPSEITGLPTKAPTKIPTVDNSEVSWIGIIANIIFVTIIFAFV